MLVWACGEEGCGGLGVKVTEVEGCMGRGRPKKTWEQSMKCNIRKYGMQRVDSFDKDKWRSCGSNRPTCASMEKRTL